MTVGKNSKGFCTCKFKENAYYGLFGAGNTKKGNIQFVHICGKPTKEVWYAWLERCPVCWGWYSSPWSEVCKVCHGETGSADPFRGWMDSLPQDSLRRLTLIDIRAES